MLLNSNNQTASLSSTLGNADDTLIPLLDATADDDHRQPPHHRAASTTLVVSTRSAIAASMAENRKLLFYAAGIFVCYFYFGILQEKM